PGRALLMVFRRAAGRPGASRPGGPHARAGRRGRGRLRAHAPPRTVLPDEARSRRPRGTRAARAPWVRASAWPSPAGHGGQRVGQCGPMRWIAALFGGVAGNVSFPQGIVDTFNRLAHPRGLSVELDMTTLEQGQQLTRPHPSLDGRVGGVDTRRRVLVVSFVP